MDLAIFSPTFSLFFLGTLPGFTLALPLVSLLFSMASSSNRRQKAQNFKCFMKGRHNRPVESSTSIPSHAKEVPLRTSLVRDSVKKRIFAYMDKGYRSGDIELKSGLSHQRVKHYRRMWKDERHDPCLRSKKWTRRKARSRVPLCEPVQLPLRLMSACGQKAESFHAANSVGDKRKPKHCAPRELKECDANPRREGARSKVQETFGMQTKESNHSVATECQLAIRLSKNSTLYRERSDIL